MALRQATPIGRDGGEGLARLIARYTRTGYVVLLATLVLLSLTSWYVMRAVQHDARLEAISNARALVEARAEAIQFRFDILAAQVRSLVQDPAIHALLSPQAGDTMEPQPIRSRVNTRLAQWNVQDFAIVTPDGQIKAAANAARIGTPHPLSERRGQWLQRVRRQGTVVFVDARTAPSRSTMQLAAPIREPGAALLGAVLLELEPHELIGEHHTAQANSNEGRSSYVFYDNGWLVGPSQQLTVDVSQDIGAARAAMSPGAKPPAVIRGVHSEAYLNHAGIPVLDAWVWLERLELGVITQVEEQRALAPYHRLRNLVWVIFSVALLLAAVLALLLMRFRQRVDHLRKISSLDPLTQLANRRRFDSELAEQWQISSRSKLPISLILIDVDCFKAYNDHYGHQAGDACLRAVAKTLAACVKRSQDLVVRYGGEEFAVLMPMTTANSALIIAEHIRARLAKLGIEHHASTVSDIVTVSMGVATLQAEARTDAKVLIEKADAYLYMAKEAGRDRIVNKELN